MTPHARASCEVRPHVGVADQAEAARLRQRIDAHFLVTGVAPRVHTARMIVRDRPMAQAALAVSHMGPVAPGACRTDVQRTDRHPIRTRPDVAVGAVERGAGLPCGAHMRNVVE